jgi:hypothetical protein
MMIIYVDIGIFRKDIFLKANLIEGDSALIILFENDSMFLPIIPHLRPS